MPNGLFRLYRPGIHQLCEALEAAVVGALDFFGKTTARKLSHPQVILKAFTADAVFGAARISAGTEFGVACFLAFHGFRLPGRQAGVKRGARVAGDPKNGN
jgi:hypothetical protein